MLGLFDGHARAAPTAALRGVMTRGCADANKRTKKIEKYGSWWGRINADILMDVHSVLLRKASVFAIFSFSGLDRMNNLLRHHI